MDLSEGYPSSSSFYLRSTTRMNIVISIQFLCNAIIATAVRLINGGVITPQLIHISGGYIFRLMSEKTLRRALRA